MMSERTTQTLPSKPVIDVEAVTIDDQKMIPTSTPPIAHSIANEELIAIEKDLIATEEKVEKNYKGWRGWLRLGAVSRVIGMLALYLYLDHYPEVHRKQHLKIKEARKETAKNLSWLAVAGEWIYAIRLKGFHLFILLLRKIFVGKEANKELRQEKQAVWLKESIIDLGPTFIKIGQALGTRADLLPLPFVKELGTLIDDVPAFPNEVAFARIEMELGRPISEVYREFESEPVAAASLGQVYRAILHSGEEVAVKVQRPNLAGVISGDIEIMRKIAQFAKRFPGVEQER